MNGESWGVQVVFVKGGDSEMRRGVVCLLHTHRKGHVMICRNTTSLIAALMGTVLSVAWGTQPVQDARQVDNVVAKGFPATPEGCGAMKNMCEAMKVKQKEADSRLERMLATMNAAPASTKVDAMVSVINELVTQRNEQRAQMGQIDVGTRAHLMQHVMACSSTEMGEKLKKSMVGCCTTDGATGEMR